MRCKQLMERNQITSPVKVAVASEGRQTGLMLEENESGEGRRRMEKSLLKLESLYIGWITTSATSSFICSVSPMSFSPTITLISFENGENDEKTP